MKIILEETNKSNKYFLEFLPSRDSEAGRLARALKCRYVACSTVLNAGNGQKALQQIRALIMGAEKTGAMVAAARMNDVTLAALRQALPELQRRGIRFCTPSELAP